MVGRWISFWDGLFSGAMLVLGSVSLQCEPPTHQHWFPFLQLNFSMLAMVSKTHFANSLEDHGATPLVPATVILLMAEIRPTACYPWKLKKKMNILHNNWCRMFFHQQYVLKWSQQGLAHPHESLRYTSGWGWFPYKLVVFNLFERYYST